MKAIGLGVTKMFRRAHHYGMLPGDKHVRVVSDIRYAQQHEYQGYDVYLPRGATSSRALPTLVFVHGGGWVMCDRKMSAAVGRTLAARGVAVVAPGYRMLPAVDQRTQRRDVQAAIEHMAEHSARRFNLDLDRMVIAGESAGAHLTLRLAQAWPGTVARPRGVVGVYGLYDLRHLATRQKTSRYRPMLAALRQGDEFFEMAREHTALRPLPWQDVPVLLMHGEADTLAPCDQSHLMADYLRQTGVDVTVKTYPKASHGFIYNGDPRRKESLQGYRALWRFMAQLGLFDDGTFPARMSSLRPHARAA